ncbi:acyltransferase [Nocardioides sp.]|uniref:acyltransferase n=1 Tax=Nocardioides sp. TaxID=35761 RepID=UPI0039C976DF
MTALLYRRAFGRLGAGTVIVRPQRLAQVRRIHIGEQCAFYEGAWLACERARGPLTIGDRNYFGHRVHLHAFDAVTIGSDCVFADDAFVASSDHERGNPAGITGTGPITIGDKVFVGQRAVVLGGVTIGDRATIAAHAVVTRDVPADATVAGVPARVIGTHTP